MGVQGQLQLAESNVEIVGASVDSILAAVEQVLTTLRDSPWTPTAVAGIALAIGISLWFAGARIARPAMIAACAVVGAVAVGSVAETWDAEPMWLWMSLGVAVGAVAGMIVFRLAVAGVIALVLGLTAPAAAAVVQNIDLVPDRPSLVSSGEALFLDDVPLEGEESESPTESDAPTMTSAIVGRASAFAGAVADEANGAWEALPEKDRLTLAGSALAGALLGLAIGFFWPGPSAAAVTSALGAAIGLPAAFLLLQRTSGAPDWLPRDGLSAVGIWLGVTMVGAMIQTATMTRRRAKSRVVVVQRQEQPAAA